MKRLHSILLAFLFLQFSAHSQWVQKHSGTPVQWSDAVSDQIFWAGRSNIAGTLTTTDGGQTWTSSTFVDPKGAPVYCIDALNADTAYVVTSEIFKTTNRGNTWVKQITNFSTGFANCIHFFDANNGVATGDPNGDSFEIYTTTNGGDSWLRVPSSNIPPPLLGEMGIVSSFAAYNNTFWFTTFGAATGQRIIRSTDRGYTWTLLTTFSIPNYATPTIEFRDSLNGKFIGNGYLIFRTSNGGMTWATDSLPSWVLYANEPAYIPGTVATYGITAIGMSGNEQQYISLISTDDGITWTRMDSWPSGGMSTQKWISKNNGWLCSEIGVYKWPGYTGKHIWRAGGSIKYGTTASGEIGDTIGISIGNYGTLPTTINALTLSSSNFSLVSPPALPLVLQPWNAIDLKISFTPQSRGLINDSLVIFSDATNHNSLSVNLSGKALQFTPPLSNYIYAASDSLYTLNLSNLKPSAVGWFENTKIEGLTISPTDSVLIGISTTVSSSTLHRIDPILGGCLPTVTIPIGNIRAIAYSNTGTLFAGSKSGNLYTINTLTGAATPIGSASGKDYQALTFNPLNGKLFASVATTTPKDGIYLVDTLTGTATLLGTTGDGKATPSIAFNADSTLYGLKGTGVLETNKLISISTTNGSGTDIGTTGKRGLQAILVKKLITGIKENNEGTELTSYELFQNYPNPFNPNTTITYALKENIQVRLTMLNLLGEEVAVLVNEEQDKGFHKVEFDGSKLSSGVYFYQLKAGNYVDTKKMILLR